MTTFHYPLHRVIEELPEYLRELTFAIASKRKNRRDAGMVLSTLQSGMASGVHGLKVVQRPDGGIEPLGLFEIVLAGTTTGKTETYKLVHSAHYAHDVLRYQAYQRDKKAGDALRLREVIQPLTNNRVLLEGLEGLGHATAISAHEGQSALKSYFFRQQLDVANVLWDGDNKVTLPCSNGDRLMAFNASLSLLVMVQADIFANYLEKYGDAARSIGFLGRCSFTVVTDAPFGINLSYSGSGACLAEYDKDVTAYLEAQHEKLEASNREREIIRFSPSAQALWFQLNQDLKERSAFDPDRIHDATNRAIQNVTRKAGVIHAYYPRRLGDPRNGRETEEWAGKPDEISANTLKAAWAIVQWNLSQFAQMFRPKPFLVPPPLKPTAHEKHLGKILEDADTIMLHFKLHCGHTGDSSAPKSAVVSRSGLYLQRFNAALFYLTDENFIVVEGDGRKSRLRAGGRPYVLTAIANEV